MSVASATRPRTQLWFEFIALFVGVPIAMAVWFEQIQQHRLLFGVIWLLAFIAMFLLWRTPGFAFSQLFSGGILRHWKLILVYWVVTAMVSTAFVFAINPAMFLSFAISNPTFWLLVMVAYPVLSAWPQEIIYRSLFFERYAVLFPGPVMLIVTNGLLFGFGHLFYEHRITIMMTAAGGMIMGWAYWKYRSLPLAWVLHAVAGQIVFTAGLGYYFYSGGVS
ncbi:MAG: CPBP family intramembrane glutamic endopeptidase [Pseudomonadota bacterium]